MTERKEVKQKQEVGFSEGRLFSLGEVQDKALLIGVFHSSKDREITSEHLEELRSLADTFGLQTVDEISCPIRKIVSATYLGKGKIEEIFLLCKEKQIDVVIFDEELSPQQQKNLEVLFQCYVIDRAELILGIFAKRAITKEARIQIEVAQLEYQLPRLKRLWTHLERQKTGGGSGGYLKGAGEKQIEIDRQIVKDRVSYLKKQLLDVKNYREIQRKARQRGNIPTFALIGYTNVGKSTLLNALTQADVFVEDKLFATLDTTTRKYTLPNRQEILLIDTVGFIRKIPHLLIDAFKSTLEESIYADILLHLIDLSSPYAEEQAETTLQVLKELEAAHLPIITVLNKIDRCENRNLIHKFRVKYPHSVAISATTKEGFHDLTERMMEAISKLRKTVKLQVPQSHYAVVAKVLKEGKVLFMDYAENSVNLEVEIPTSLEKLVEPFVVINFS